MNKEAVKNIRSGDFGKVRWLQHLTLPKTPFPVKWGIGQIGVLYRHPPNSPFCGVIYYVNRIHHVKSNF
jgi:hypothetical protein